MSSTYTCLKYHIVFATHQRRPFIADPWRAELHAYIGGVVRNLGAMPMIVGGVADHVHLLAGLKATHAPADLVREVKKVSSVWAAEREGSFRWQEGYGAFTVGVGELPKLTAYIARQADHHRKVSSADELRSLLAEHGIEYDERFFE